MRVLGIDAGTNRIGVALSDESGLIANPLETISALAPTPQILDRIEDLCRAHEVDCVVVGLPLTLGGEGCGISARRARRLGETIAERVGIRVDYWDERFSTAAAERSLLEAGVRRENRRQVVDKVAAAWILQAYLDARDAVS
jgi:putative holliday junction resolvase